MQIYSKPKNHLISTTNNNKTLKTVIIMPSSFSKLLPSTQISNSLNTIMLRLRVSPISPLELPLEIFNPTLLHRFPEIRDLAIWMKILNTSKGLPEWILQQEIKEPPWAILNRWTTKGIESLTSKEFNILISKHNTYLFFQKLIIWLKHPVFELPKTIIIRLIVRLP